ncbi:Gfo/Idh/MocA family protein [Pedobacter immunditicola]|uniref:Gfo/Idh/MocA family protein n=1 Tax=Pedobacter immunditicola TaxID=3133440 RepID=UPI0030B08AFB
MPDTIKWGMIGCGNVTEVKSGPAFNKVPHSILWAVTSRSPEKAADYARRHLVPKCYASAEELLADPEINAVYIATPPDSHEFYAIAAMKAGKSVYVEKPMAVGAAASKRMLDAAQRYGVKLTVAHYRREQPVFRKIKSLIDEKAIGTIKFITLNYFQPALSEKEMTEPKNQWRVNPEIAGGGLFHDIAPHQLDMMLHLFGPVDGIAGTALQQADQYAADDMVAGILRFENKAVFTGAWCFSAPPVVRKDICEITGTAGRLSFSFFGQPVIEITTGDTTQTIRFDTLPHVQQPMIEATVKYFLNQKPNPCSAEIGFQVMNIIDNFTRSPSHIASVPL